MNNKLIKQVIDSNADVVYPRTVADAIIMEDEHGDPTTLQAVLDAIGPVSGSASAVAIIDTNGFYIGTSVEAALQEIGFAITNKAAAIHNHNTEYYTKTEIDTIINSLDITANQVNLTNGVNSTDIVQGSTGVIFDSVLYGGQYRIPRVYVQDNTTMPVSMQNGDLLLVKPAEVAFSEVTNFPQNFGTTYTWEERGPYTTTTEMLTSWSSMTSTNNPIIKAIHSNSYFYNYPPTIMFDGNTAWDNQHYGYFTLSNYGTIVIQFNGRIRFKGFRLWGSGQGHAPWVYESPKSLAFYGSNDGLTWTLMYSTNAFPDTNAALNPDNAYADFADQTKYYEYIKLNIRGTYDNSSPRYCIRELQFKADGYRYL